MTIAAGPTSTTLPLYLGAFDHEYLFVFSNSSKSIGVKSSSSRGLYPPCCL